VFDQIERDIGIEAFHHDRGNAEGGRSEVRGPEAETEWSGQHAQEHLVVGEASGIGRESMEVEPTVLGVHHALGEPSGSGGGVQEEQTIGIDGAQRSFEIDRCSIGNIGIDDPTIGADDQVALDGRTQVLGIGTDIGRTATMEIGRRDQCVGVGEGEQMGDLSITGS
jgi:hypothetical protein